MNKSFTTVLGLLGLGLGLATAQTDTLQGHLTANKTLTSGTTWILKGYVIVDSGFTLTIEPGTTVKGQKSSKGTLAIRRGAKIIAAGTANNPITFTSDEPDTVKTRGSWGGLVLLGAAVTNKGTDNFEANSSWNYGGTNDDDSSGVLTYVRIDHPGFPVAPDKELNGLTMCAVGRKTVIHHVQVHAGDDDGFEFFGGTVNPQHLVVTNEVDDGFDSDNGFRGTLQWGLVIQGAESDRQRCYARIGLPDTCFPNEVVGDKCFESSSTKLAGGASVLPQTRPTWKNITAIDNGKSGGCINLNEHAVGSFERVLLVGDSSQYAVKLQSSGTNGGLLAGTPTLAFSKSYLGGTWKAKFQTDDTANASTITALLTAMLPNIAKPLYKDLGVANDSLRNDSVGAIIGNDPSQYWYKGWTLPNTVSWSKGIDRPSAIRTKSTPVSGPVFSAGVIAGQLVIRSAFAIRGDIEVVDFNGRTVLHRRNLSLNQGVTTLGRPWGNHSAGIYFISLKSGNTTTHLRVENLGQWHAPGKTDTHLKVDWSVYGTENKSKKIQYRI